MAGAREIGYERIFLDTLPSISTARALDHSFGFVEVAPCCHNPIPDASYLALELRTQPTGTGQGVECRTLCHDSTLNRPDASR